MKPNSISTLQTWVLNQLGAPVIDIHVAEEQLENRIEEALDFFQDFHSDGTERTYLQHQITGNQIATPVATSFTIGEMVTGSVSGAFASVITKSNGILTVGTPTGTFIVGETIVGNQSNVSGLLNSYTTGDIDNHYITVSPDVTAIMNVYPVTSSISNSLFSASYQMKVEDLWALQNQGMGGDLSDYERTMEYLNTLDSVLTGEIPFRFNKRTSMLHLDMDWSTVSVGDFIVVEARKIVDPNTYTSLFNDRMLKKLATAYVKRQWGSNLKMLSGIQLPGGVTINGQQIFDEAIEEIEQVENQIRSTFEEPVMFLVG